MPEWNDTFDENLQWQQADFLNMFTAAMRERRAALLGDAAVTAIPLVEVGDIVQQASFIRGWQSMDWLGFGRSFFIDPSEMQGWDDALSPPPPIQTTFPPPPRRRPREVDSRSATEDIQGNPAQVGQKAYLVTRSGGIVVSHGPIVEYDGDEWVDAAGPPDMLSSDLASPFHVEPGYIQVGDYIGYWLFNDLRDRLNKMTATCVRWTWADTSRRAVISDQLDTIDEAKDDAEAKFAIAGASGGYQGYWTQIEESAGSPPRYRARIEAGEHKGKLWASTSLIPNVPDTTMARTVEFYIFGLAPTDGSFDDNGYPLIEGKWNLWETIPETTTRYVETSTAIGSDSTVPAWAPLPNGARHGFGFPVFEDEPFVGGFAVLHWDVPGGFQYTAST